ncbi:sugar transferase [Acinetobacter sp. 187]|nr:sugar transferase [Acinetobacter lanii]
MSTINMSHTKIRILQTYPRILKRSFDIVFAVFFIFLLCPFILIIVFLVKRDGGPAFYGHERIGQNGQKFKCLKFRSMAVNSQELLEKILAEDENACLEWKTTFKLKNDPRITKVGHFLRKTSLDELPQLLNILKGEMSAVGPRPVTEDELKMYDDSIHYYLMTKPGLTGLWQVSGRNDVDYATRVGLDRSYIQNWSFMQDIVIILKTVKVVLSKDGAY